ncbi:tetratricopeptide repeat-containing sensor histidine kinase [Formosa algae]|uniref:Tetratricopeptide (TPR) repeat protein n=1 Tax=Formosa algae TaxID=225843 RepID=A0A9X0YHJ5_9FLAO|nr:tetratricopeptide repeat protein [Formosa algae]MBP1838449.1 tetratricopeptide (TPR) repeat protein [Formosa algae]MDQ0334584.1 tetratricopeptide (TPR) repeat protein [Formosa algae]OEI79120.1 histidine kinase [Formosa algae]
MLKRQSLIENTYIKLPIVFFWIVLLSCFQLSTAQNNTLDTLFIERVKTAFKNKPKDYRALETIFYNDKGDVLKMEYIINQATLKQYPEAECYALNALGTTNRNKSLYEPAIQLHKKALEIAIEADNDVFHIMSLNLIGVVYRRMDLVKPALDYHKEAYDLASKMYKINPDTELKRSMAVSRNSMGNIYLVLKQYDLALKQFEKSLFIETEGNNKLGLAINYQNIGIALEHKGQLDEALKNYKISLDFNNQIDSKVGRVICHNAITKIYIKQGKFEEALELNTKALAEAQELGDQYYLAETYVNLGRIQEKLGQNEAAENNLKTALQISRTYDLKTFTSESLLYLSEVYFKSENYKDAHLFYKESKEIENSITNDRNLNYVNDLIIQYEHESKNNQIQELADENEIVRNKLERNKKLFWYTAILISLFTTMIIIIIRHRQLKQEKQIITLEQDMLRSQMNPHFIFNSLNSIKLYIINNDKEKAVYYLNKFSKLIRKILIASTEKEMTLEDELDTMQLYLNIENIRFENEIEFRMHVPEDIDTKSVKVPSLILQPFLENALWHGLSSKKHDRKIDLYVSKDSEDYINISIIDNGIGRIEAEKINSLKVLKRKSVGIAITKARLANFSKRYTKDYKFDIEDLYTEKDRPKGTKVILQIPILKNKKT